MTTPAVTFINDHLKPVITQLTDNSGTGKRPMLGRYTSDFLRKYHTIQSVDANYLTIINITLQKEKNQPDVIEFTLFDSMKPRVSDYQTLISLLTGDNLGFIVIESKKSHIIPDSYGALYFEQPVVRLMNHLTNQTINDVLDTPAEAHDVPAFIASINSGRLCLIDTDMLKLYDLLIDLNQMDVVRVYRNGNVFEGL